jgi:hypothetical protein
VRNVIAFWIAIHDQTPVSNWQTYREIHVVERQVLGKTAHERMQICHPAIGQEYDNKWDGDRDVNTTCIVKKRCVVAEASHMRSYRQADAHARRPWGIWATLPVWASR